MATREEELQQMRNLLGKIQVREEISSEINKQRRELQSLITKRFNMMHPNNFTYHEYEQNAMRRELERVTNEEYRIRLNKVKAAKVRSMFFTILCVLVASLLAVWLSTFIFRFIIDDIIISSYSSSQLGGWCLLLAFIMAYIMSAIVLNLRVDLCWGCKFKSIVLVIGSIVILHIISILISINLELKGNGYTWERLLFEEDWWKVLFSIILSFFIAGILMMFTILFDAPFFLLTILVGKALGKGWALFPYYKGENVSQEYIDKGREAFKKSRAYQEAVDMDVTEGAKEQKKYRKKYIEAWNATVQYNTAIEQKRAAIQDLIELLTQEWEKSNDVVMQEGDLHKDQKTLEYVGAIIYCFEHRLADSIKEAVIYIENRVMMEKFFTLIQNDLQKIFDEQRKIHSAILSQSYELDSRFEQISGRISSISGAISEAARTTERATREAADLINQSHREENERLKYQLLSGR